MTCLDLFDRINLPSNITALVKKYKKTGKKIMAKLKRTMVFITLFEWASSFIILRIKKEHIVHYIICKFHKEMLNDVPLAISFKRIVNACMFKNPKSIINLCDHLSIWTWNWTQLLKGIDCMFLFHRCYIPQPLYSIYPPQMYILQHHIT